MDFLKKVHRRIRIKLKKQDVRPFVWTSYFLFRFYFLSIIIILAPPKIIPGKTSLGSSDLYIGIIRDVA